MSELHMADAEGGFKVVNISPDFCIVGGVVVPFDIYRNLPPEKSAYAHTVRARKQYVLPMHSVVQGVVGNAGSGISSGVSTGGGDTVLIEGASNVRVEGRHVSRHGDLCHMNVSS
ncbi:MAG: hypothetical protein AB7S26_04860 [Sandaracinaceae bacterium]